jgi:hypothetical protein
MIDNSDETQCVYTIVGRDVIEHALNNDGEGGV